MAIVEVSVVPIGTRTPSISHYVAKCIELLKKKKKNFELTAMGTNIEGDLKGLVRIALRMHEVPFDMGAKRVVTTIRIDDRRDKKATISSKKRAVELRMMRK